MSKALAPKGYRHDLRRVVTPWVSFCERSFEMHRKPGRLVDYNNLPTDPISQIKEFYEAVKDRRSMSAAAYLKYHRVIPYVFMYTTSGRTVLLNRKYQPLVETMDGAWINTPPEWVHDVFMSEYVYNDGCVPCQNRDTFDRIKAILALVLMTSSSSYDDRRTSYRRNIPTWRG